MSYHVKTSYVRPHTKTSYIRPLGGCSDNETMLKDSAGKQSDQFMNNETSCSPVKSALVSNSLDNINDTKEKHIQSLNSAHAKLYDEIEKIQTWTTSVKLESKQKNKKLDELGQIVESQRKVVLDLQMQNEKLSMQLSEEIQQRIAVLEKFYYSKELYTTIKKKFNDLQGEFDNCQKIKDAVNSCNEERIKAVEALSKKYDTMCTEYSEKITYLIKTLENEKNNVMMLKGMCEQQNVSAEKEHKSFCKLIENYQVELKNFSKDLEDEKSKVSHLEYEKCGMLQKISHLEETSEINLKKLKETEEQLKLVLENKFEIEKSLASEKENVNNLNKNCEELKKLKDKQKDEYEENCFGLKTKINTLENCLMELKLKYDEMQSNYEKLSIKLQETENEKNTLEKDISIIKEEKQKLEDKLIIDAKIADEITTQLMKEKNNLDTILKNTNEELQETLSEKEKLSKICLEKEEKLSKIINELSVATSKIDELKNIEEKYSDTLKIIEEMEVQNKKKLEYLASKDKKIKELNEIDEKYTESLRRIENLEKSLQSKTEQIEMKEMRIEELCSVEKKYVEAEERIKEMECDIEAKKEILISKDLKIEEFKNVEVNYHKSVEKVKVLENDIQQNLELLASKEKMIEDLNVELNENGIKLEKLEYENIALKDNIIAERESVKVCLECEIMKDKVKEFGETSRILKNTQKELENQRQRAEETLKLLSETEDNFDDMRINKEKEIIKYKDSIQGLQQELRVLKVEVRDAENLRTENESLQMKIEELTLQNNGDFQRLKAENEKLKRDIEDLKAKMNMVDFGENISEEKCKQNGVKKEFEKHQDSFMKQNEKSSFLQRVKNGEKMEADSSHDDDVIFLSKEIKKSVSHKKLCKEEDKKIASVQKKQNVSSYLEKRKRAWESESSGSECLEIVFDKDAKKLMGLTPKGKLKLSSELKVTPIVGTPDTVVSSQDRRTKRDILTIMDEESLNHTPNIKTRTTLSFSAKRSPIVKKPMKTDVSDSGDFLSSRQKSRQENYKDLSLAQMTAESQGTPSTPSRRFFKTPLKERDFSFKKPQSQNMWF